MGLVAAWRAFVAAYKQENPNASEEDKSLMAGIPAEVLAEIQQNANTQNSQRLAALQAQTEQLQAQLTDVKSRERAALLHEFKSEGKILPAAEAAASTLLAAGTDVAQAFTAFLELNGTVAAFRHDAVSEGAPNARTMDGAQAAANMDSQRDDQTLHNLAAARAKRDGIGYAEALKIVATENPAIVESMMAKMPVLG